MQVIEQQRSVESADTADKCTRLLTEHITAQGDPSSAILPLWVPDNSRNAPGSVREFSRAPQGEAFEQQRSVESADTADKCARLLTEHITAQGDPSSGKNCTSVTSSGF